MHKYLHYNHKNGAIKLDYVIVKVSATVTFASSIPFISLILSSPLPTPPIYSAVFPYSQRCPPFMQIAHQLSLSKRTDS